MDLQKRIVRLSIVVLSELLRTGNTVHFKVLQGFPPEVEILHIQNSPDNLGVDITVKGHFAEGKDGEIFDIVARDINEPIQTSHFDDDDELQTFTKAG
jgi:hypothetical protein